MSKKGMPLFVEIENAKGSNFYPSNPTSIVTSGVPILGNFGTRYGCAVIPGETERPILRGISTEELFSRNQAQAEIDYVEEYDDRLYAYEFKWGNKDTKIPKAFGNAYPGSSFEVINRENFLDFVV